MNQTIHTDVLVKHKFLVGSMLGSKSGYRKRYPDNKVLFNANIITSLGKIWWGDLDITERLEDLKEVSRELEEPLYILQEFACRWELENSPVEELKERAAYIITSEVITEGKRFTGFTHVNGQLKLF